MPRYQFTKEDRQKGARNQPRAAKITGGQIGFWVTIERHPWMRFRLAHAPGMTHFDPQRFNPQKQEG